jgi:excisionase family DNA binding protein
MSTSPVFRVSAPDGAPDVLDHLSRSERLMTARELASILAISPKTIYSYAERNMIPHFKIEANVRFRGRDIAEWLRNHASFRREATTTGRSLR